MKRFLLVMLFFAQTCINGYAQNKLQVDCNTIFIGIDRVTYETLFLNKYLKDTLFFCRQNATQTNKESYEGKYFIGEGATIEFFCAKPNGKLGDKLGDVGIELKTRSVNQLAPLIGKAEKLHLAIDTANIIYKDADTSMVWYNTLSLVKGDKNLGFSVLEYQAEYLQYLGFSDTEILSPMTFVQYNSKLSGGKPYPRLFSAIKSVSISASAQQIKKMKAFSGLNNFTNSAKKSSNGDFEIFYQTSSNKSALKLQSVEITLLKWQAKRTITISNALTVIVDGKLATLIFN